MPKNSGNPEAGHKRLVNRRTLLKGSAGAAALAAGAAIPAWWGVAQRSSGTLRTVNPRSFGARGDGQAKDTVALQQAIDSCAAAGGGTVLLSPGTYLSGTLVLKSNITLEVQAGATILGSPDPNDYTLPQDTLTALHGAFTGRHLIFAFKAENVTLRGPGIIDGHSSVFLASSGRPQPKPEDLWKSVVSAETVRVVRISPMVELANCNNVLVENITLQNAAGWTLRPIGCNTVRIQGVKIRNPLNASNADGIDPTSCEDVLITNCDIVTGDDAICVKSNNTYGGNTVCRNVTVTNCRVSTCCNGLKVGVEGPAGFENIVFKDCEIYSGDVPFNQRVISGIAIEMDDGAYIDGVTATNITMTNVRTPIFIRLQGSYEHTQNAVQGRLENINISGVKAIGAILTSSITGQPGLPVQQITLSNMQITTDEPGKQEWTSLTIPEQTHNYSEATMMGRLPSYGLYARHVKGLKLEDVSIRSQKGDPRPLLVCEDVQALIVERITGTPSGRDEAFLDLRDVQTAMIRENMAPEETNNYIRLSGEATHNVRLINNDLRRAKQPIQLASEVHPDAIAKTP